MVLGFSIFESWAPRRAQYQAPAQEDAQLRQFLSDRPNIEEKASLVRDWIAWALRDAVSVEMDIVHLASNDKLGITAGKRWTLKPVSSAAFADPPPRELGRFNKNLKLDDDRQLNELLSEFTAQMCARYFKGNTSLVLRVVLRVVVEGKIDRTYSVEARPGARNAVSISCEWITSS